MELQFDPVEIRVLGVLIEKQITTPDYYPLTVNALLNGCNQKSNRAPVLELEEAAVLSALGKLQLKHLIRKILLSNSRVYRYSHLFDDVYRPTMHEKVVLCELFLRGPQTVGELRTRAERMFPLASLEQAQQVLDELAARADGPFVKQLPRQPGHKECRYMHLFSGEPEFTQSSSITQKPPGAKPAVAPENFSLLQSLELKIGALETEITELKARVEKLESERAE